MSTLYKSKAAQFAIFQLYDEKLKSLDIPYQEIDVDTVYGRTRIIKTGNEQGPTIVLFHGINAGAPLALEAVKELREQYLLIAIDTIGQATKSAEHPLSIKDNAYALWADEVLEQLAITEANFIGISYGAFILQKLITFRPQRVAKCIFVVPAGLVNGALLPSFTQLSWPLMRYLITKKDHHLRSFLRAFVAEENDFMFRLQKALLAGVNIDYRRPGLLQASDVHHYNNPVYLIVADQDIFFPGPAAAKRAQEIFPNLQEVHFLINSRHIPHRSQFAEIQGKIVEWVGAP
ncbi:MAG: alpha/beta hydrolase [Bacteroidota bacterium]